MIKANLKHREVYNALATEIAEGTYDASLRIPSEAQLVRRFGVSRPTAARALRDLQAEGVISRQAGSGSFLLKGVKPSGLANKRKLGFLIPNMGVSEIFDAVCGELASFARVEDYSLLCADGCLGREPRDLTVKGAEKVCAHLIDSGVSGVFFAPYEFAPDKEKVSKRTVDLLRRAGICVILLDRDMVPFPLRSDFDLVGLDNVAAGYLAAEHLLKLGVKRPAFVARAESAPTIAARIAGAREAILGSGLEIPRKFVYWGNPEDRSFVRQLITARQTDGVICANDLTAAQLMKSFAEIKVRVPDDVRLVGFDNLKYAELLGVPLTTISQPSRALATHAMRLMIDRLKNATLPTATLLVSPQLMVRASCGAFLSGRESPH